MLSYYVCHEPPYISHKPKVGTKYGVLFCLICPRRYPLALGSKMSDCALLFCAIDIGTSFSGYAFAPRENLTVTPSNIYASNWGSELLSAKAPTSLLLDPSMTFHSFGHDAVKKYAILAEKEQHAAWYFFKDFKMELYKSVSLIQIFIFFINKKFNLDYKIKLSFNLAPTAQKPQK